LKLDRRVEEYLSMQETAEILADPAALKRLAERQALRSD
jgi:PHD/YefM family antitoxin component YafN of YafNO toxin-antitoxin module